MFAITFREQSDLPNVLGHIGVSERPKDVGHLILARINGHVADELSETAVCTVSEQDRYFPEVQEVDMTVCYRACSPTDYTPEGLLVRSASWGRWK
jgi:hypothetical protein